MIPGRHTLQPHYKGDTWSGFAVGPITKNEEAPETTLVSARLQFRDKYDTFGYEFNSITNTCKGTIVIVDPVLWTIQIGPGEVDLEKGLWKWDLELVDNIGTRKTYLKGTIRILDEITKVY